LFGFIPHQNAQGTAYASCSATIVTPINLVKLDDLHFGNIAIGNSIGSVQLNPEGTRTVTGGATLPSVSGTVSAAEFTVFGMEGYSYSVLLPSSVIITNTTGTGSETMLVDMFVSNPSSNGTLGTNGSETLDIGATVHVSGNQPYGNYISPTPFEVTVAYN
jgi:hypothetical protein